MEQHIDIFSGCSLGFSKDDCSPIDDILADFETQNNSPTLLKPQNTLGDWKLWLQGMPNFSLGPWDFLI